MTQDKIFSIGLICMLAFTALVVSLQKFSLNYDYIIDANSTLDVKWVTETEHIENGSTATLTRDGDAFILECEIVKTDYGWPFCEISILLADYSKPPQDLGVDLSTFHSVDIWAKYSEPNGQALRLQIRSFDEKYSTMDDHASWKYNGIEYRPEKSSYPTSLPLDTLQVYTWWLVERDIPLEYYAPDISNAVLIELSTGSYIPPGKYTIILEKLVFHGKYFNDEQVYSFIITMWVISALLTLSFYIAKSQKKARIAERKSYELRQLNRLLNVETKQLKDIASRDPLTGCLNRAGVQPAFTNQIKLLSLIFIDIDHFKSINDTYGHDVGDDILKQFAACISESCRTTDFLSRWGGEEFLLVCPNTDLSQASNLAEDIRHIITQHDWAKGIGLTASFGVAQRQKESPAKFIKRADEALYAAKARGRNRVVVADD